VGLTFGCLGVVFLSVVVYRNLKIKTQSTESISDLLRDIETTTRLKTEDIHVLGDPKSEGVITRLIDYMGEPDQTGRMNSWNAAMEALAKIGSPAVPKLIEAIQDAPNRAASFRFADGTKLSGIYIQTETDKLRIRAAMVLGRIGDARALPVLRDLPRENGAMSLYVSEALKSIEKANDRRPRPSTDQTSSDDEMYEVYSTVIKELYLNAGEMPRTYGAEGAGSRVARLVVIRDYTIGGSFDPFESTSAWRTSGIFVDDETIDDFKRKKSDSVSLEPLFSFPAKQVLVSDHKSAGLFRRARHIDRSWTGFYKRYPNSVGFISMSRVGFNGNHDQALLYIARFCGGLCGEGYYVILDKERGAWSVKEKTMLWIS